MRQRQVRSIPSAFVNHFADTYAFKLAAFAELEQVADHFCATTTLSRVRDAEIRFLKLR
jgi:hypothetical protein